MMPHPKLRTRKKAEGLTIEFRFASAELARRFLGYMSDGGGEYRFLAGDDVRDVAFDYHTANGGKFGQYVTVTGEVVDDDE